MLSKVLKLLFFALLLVATHQSLVPRPASAFESISDKTLHVACWGILSASMSLAFPRSGQLEAMFLGLFGYSVAIEVGQIFVQGRSFSGLDIIANGCGCLLVYLIVATVNRRRALNKEIGTDLANTDAQRSGNR